MSRDLFPEMTPDEIRANVRKVWDLSGPLPVPATDDLPRCGCGSTELHVREWRIGHRDSGQLRKLLRMNRPISEADLIVKDDRHRLQWRADISFKCLVCSVVFAAGIPIDPEDAKRFGHDLKAPHPTEYSWREGKARLDAQNR